MAENCVVGKILEAVNFACIKHKDQRRNDPSQTPYINHPIGVAYILWKEAGITDIATIQVFTTAINGLYCDRLYLENRCRMSN